MHNDQPQAVSDLASSPMTGTTPPGAPRPESRRGDHFGQARANAELTLRDADRAHQLATAAREKARRPGTDRLGDVEQDLGALIRLMHAYADGTFRAIAWENLVLAAAALFYFVSPEDIVPDYLDEGYIDDAAIIAFVCEMIAPDLDGFLIWEQVADRDPTTSKS